MTQQFIEERYEEIYIQAFNISTEFDTGFDGIMQPDSPFEIKKAIVQYTMYEGVQNEVDTQQHRIERINQRREEALAFFEEFMTPEYFALKEAGFYYPYGFSVIEGSEPLGVKTDTPDISYNPPTPSGAFQAHKAKYREIFTNLKVSQKNIDRIFKHLDHL